MKTLRFVVLFAVALSVPFLFSACDQTCEHEYSAVSLDAKCDSAVSYTQKCVKCGEESEVTIQPVGHNLKKTTTAPNCTSDGYTEYTCHCGFSFKSDKVSAKGHDYKETVISPSCTESGYTLYTCRNCNSTYKDKVVSAIGHDFVGVKTNANCTDQGFTEYFCQRCDYSYKSDYIAPLGHSLDSIVTDSDCLNSGYTRSSCNRCEYFIISDFTPPKGHDFSEDILSEATCNRQGEILYTCTCGYCYSEIIAPSGHSFEKTVVSPTVSDMGYTEFSCYCGFSYKGDFRFYSDILENAYANNDQVLARGIDISKWNHKVDSSGNYEPIDWVSLKESGVDYVILKIGSTSRDGGTLGGLEPTFEMDYHGAKAAGIDVGVYYFTYATTVSEIRKDAEAILSWLDGKQFEYPIYLDIEDEPNEGYYPSEIASPILTEMCLEFFSALQKEGYYTGLYVNNEFLFNILQTDNMIALFEIWYARYPSLDPIEWNVDNENLPSWNVEKYGEHLGMWQYSMKGTHPSILGDLDLNFAYKNYPDLIKNNAFNGFDDAIQSDE